MPFEFRCRRALLVAFSLAALAFAASSSHVSAQPPSIEPLGWLDANNRHSVATAVSRNGRRVAGHSRNRQGFDNAFVYEFDGTLTALGWPHQQLGNSYATAVTETNPVVAGYWDGPYGFTNAYVWGSIGHMLPLPGWERGIIRDSFVFDATAQYLVGSAYEPNLGYLVPTRWESPYVSNSEPELAFESNLQGQALGLAGSVCLGTSGTSGTFGNSGRIGTLAVSGTPLSGTWDATTVVGYRRNTGWDAVRWDGTVRTYLPTLSGILHSCAYDISYGGEAIVGAAAVPGESLPAQGDAYVWFADGSHGFLRDILVDEYGVDLTGWGRLYAANSCSADGSFIVGSGDYDGATTAFRVFLPLDQSRPTVESAIEPGETYDVPLGGAPFSATFAGQDEDGDELTLSATGLPPSAQLVPAAGSTGAPPFAATLELTPTLADVGEHEVTIAFADEAYAGKPGSIRFTLNVPPNNVPTATSPAPVTVECEGEVNVVELSTTVDDADGHPLTVVWKVDGEVRQTTPNVPPGTSIDFEHGFGGGESAVTVEVSDGFETGIASTTVTVEDTTAPAIVVAEDVVVATDFRKSFASGVSLTPPSVTDLCDGEPTLTHDAPPRFPLGETIVVWTAVDADGNSATGTQKVTVVDEEAPRFGAVRAVRRFVDPGKLFSTAPLVPPVVVDNVREGLKTTHGARPRLPIGTTVVTWTATDAAGNRVTAKQNVTVVNRKPKANAGKPIRISTTSDRGARATLDGSASSDPDRHKLKYAWRAPA